MRTGDSRSRHGWIWPAQHHGYIEQGFDLQYRSSILARRIIQQKRDGQELGLGHWVEDFARRGDIIGLQSLLKTSRQTSTWRFATPVLAGEGDDGGDTPAPAGGAGPSGFSFGIGGTAGPSGNQPGASFTPQPVGPLAGTPNEPAPEGPDTPTGTSADDCATLDEFNLIPILGKEYSPDTRLATFEPEVPIRDGKNLWPKFPLDWIGISLIGDEENFQVDLYHPTDPRLVAVHREGDVEMGTIVTDMGENFKTNPDRNARLQTAFRPILEPNSQCISFHGENTIALNITHAGCADSTGGLWIDLPKGGGSTTADARVLAHFSNEQGGPLVAGLVNDKHKFGEDGDGIPMNSGHIALKTLLWFSKVEDGPNKYDGIKTYPDFPKPDAVFPAPFSTQVYYEFDPNLKHEVCGVIRDGEYRWRAAQWLYEPTDGGGVPPPPDRPPPPPPPPGGVPTPPSGDGGGFPPTPTPGGLGGDGLEGGLPLPPTEGGGFTGGGGEPSAAGIQVVAGASTNLVAVPPESTFDPPFLQEVIRLGLPLKIAAQPTGNQRRRICAMVNECGEVAVLGRPQFINNIGRVDLRNANSISNAEIAIHDATTPIVGRFEWMGANDGSEWLYTEDPVRSVISRFVGGTAPGSYVFMPPEVDAADIDTNFAPDAVPLSKVSILTVPGTLFASGLFDNNTGNVKAGYEFGAPDPSDVLGDLNFDCVSADGLTTTRVLTLRGDDRRPTINECLFRIERAIEKPIRTVAAADTFTDADYTIKADATGGAFAVLLPPASDCPGRVYNLKRINAGGNAVTLTAFGADTIDGAATVVIVRQFVNLKVQSDGVSEWSKL